MAELIDVARSELANHYRTLAERVERLARAVPPERLWTNPFEGFGNSIGHLLLHLTGNLNHFVGARIAGNGYVRDRDREFREDDPPGPDRVLGEFRDAVALVVDAIERIDAEELHRADDAPTVSTRLGTFMMCGSHLNHHLGQMLYLARALGCDPQGPPRW